MVWAIRAPSGAQLADQPTTAPAPSQACVRGLRLLLSGHQLLPVLLAIEKDMVAYAPKLVGGVFANFALNLSQKGFEQRPERGFGRYIGAKTGRIVPLRHPGCHVCRPFGTFQTVS